LDFTFFLLLTKYEVTILI